MSDFFLDVLGFVIAVASWSPLSLLIFSDKKPTTNMFISVKTNKFTKKSYVATFSHVFSLNFTCKRNARNYKT